ncbi:DUF5828 family protein [Halalkalicoccus tibetensis]|uniref:DUF5828 family protein n=1 Tax=Halalkalicoccus tibetensis TaxID=175632 RepID=A0ABD5V857_9EURY
MEESVSGFEVTGTWGDIVEHGERITAALEATDADSEEFEAWDEWRPKADDRLDDEISRRTSEQASVDEGRGERVGRTAEEDLRAAGEKLSESYERMGEEGDAQEAVHDSVDHATRAADTAGRKVLRAVEDTVYQGAMTEVAPYYFDGELVSANVAEVSRFGGSDEFVLEVDINDDELKEEISELLAEYDDEIDRWHIETDPKTANSAAAEGIGSRNPTP